MLQRLEDGGAVGRRRLREVALAQARARRRGQLPGGVDAQLGDFLGGRQIAHPLPGGVGVLRLARHREGVLEDRLGRGGGARRGFLDDVPAQAVNGGEVGEEPGAAVPDAELPLLEEPGVVVGAAAHLRLGGHGAADLAGQPPCGGDALRAVEGDPCAVLGQEAAAVLRQGLGELQVGGVLVVAEHAVAEGGDLPCGPLLVLPGPVRGGIGHARRVEELLVVEEEFGGEAGRQAVLPAVVAEAGQRGRGEVAGHRVGADAGVEVGEGSGVREGGELVLVELEDVRGGATGRTRLQLGEVLVERRALDLDVDARMGPLEGRRQPRQVLEVVGRGGERHVVHDPPAVPGRGTGHRTVRAAGHQGDDRGQERGRAQQPAYGPARGGNTHRGLPTSVRWWRSNAPRVSARPGRSAASGSR